MTPSFNLIDQPWIPCVDATGNTVHLGVLDTLSRAHEFKEIRDESPLVTVTLHRMLLAVLHRAFDGPKKPADWAKLWNDGNGSFDGSRLEAYLRRKDIHPRFDLFHPTHPFYQTGALPLGEPDKKNGGRPKFVKPIWQMAHELAYSDPKHLFAHFHDGDWETRPAAEAARWLVAFQAFALGGLITTEEGKKAQDGSADAGQLVKSAVVLARGETLFQTLMLNLVHYSVDDEMPFAFKPREERPAWEATEPVQPADRPFRGYLDLLTWQSRRVKLVPDVNAEGELLGVSGVVAMKGWQLPGFDRRDRETMVGFVKSEKPQAGQDPWPPLGFKAGKELWRDCHALFQTRTESSARPQVLSWVDDLRTAGYLNWSQVLLDVHGLSADRAKIFYWRHESLPLPLDYLRNPELVQDLRRSVSLAESVVTDALRKAVWITAAGRLAGDSGMNPDTDRVRALVDSFAPERLYWSRLERPYRELLVALAAAQDRPALIRAWFLDTLKPAAVEAFDDTIGRIDSGRDLKAVTAGRGVLFGLLKKLEPEDTSSDSATPEVPLEQPVMG